MAKQSMNEFLQQVGTMLYRYLRKRGLPHEGAEDIVQDTCYKFLNQKFSQYGITSEQWTLLKRLDEQDGISIKDLNSV